MTGPDRSELNSCLYEGIVTHRRYVELGHRFRYRLFQHYLDLDELSDVFDHRWLWSRKRFAPGVFRREDHLGDASISLKDAIKSLIFERTGMSADGPVRLLTNLRYYGFQMNPVSFYYCYDSAGAQVEFFVAEVSNTPWGERHCYVFTWSNVEGEKILLKNEKAFHVSPFLPMDMEYRWQVSEPAEKLNVKIENYKCGELAFEAVLAMKRVPLTTLSMNSLLIRYPSMTGKVFAGIYWQALKLWWKGATYHPHPNSEKVG